MVMRYSWLFYMESECPKLNVGGVFKGLWAGLEIKSFYSSFAKDTITLCIRVVSPVMVFVCSLAPLDMHLLAQSLLVVTSLISRSHFFFGKPATNGLILLLLM